MLIPRPPHRTPPSHHLTATPPPRLISTLSAGTRLSLSPSTSLYPAVLTSLRSDHHIVYIFLFFPFVFSPFKQKGQIYYPLIIHLPPLQRGHIFVSAAFCLFAPVIL